MITGTFPPTLWSHYDNTGPRTSNVAEGWHNALNTTFGVSHPSCRTFHNWLQKQQYAVYCRQVQLKFGATPKAKDPRYIALNEKINSAKLQFGIRWGNLFINTYPDTYKFNYFLISECYLYLDYISNLIGCNKTDNIK